MPSPEVLSPTWMHKMTRSVSFAYESIKDSWTHFSYRKLFLRATHRSQGVFFFTLISLMAIFPVGANPKKTEIHDTSQLLLVTHFRQTFRMTNTIASFNTFSYSVLTRLKSTFSRVKFYIPFHLQRGQSLQFLRVQFHDEVSYSCSSSLCGCTTK